MSWHIKTISEVFKELKSEESGLSVASAQERLQEHGKNLLEAKEGRSPVKMLLEQFAQTMILILVGACVLSLFMGKYLEASSIFLIVVLFAILGFVQEYRAEKAIAALRKMAIPSVRVRREGNIIEIPAEELVPGDVVVLEAGNAIPADMRILESASLKVQEAALTGESEPVEKSTEALKSAEVPLGDRVNMAYSGTVVTYGRGSGLVTATGMKTELGKIAGLIQQVQASMTPLQRKLDHLGKALAIAGVLIAIVIMVLGLLRGEELVDMILAAISIAVAIVPEGLPAVVTITLAIGAQRMLRKNALIRKLPAVETLGSVTYICSDKTGTLTENRMKLVYLESIKGNLEVDSNLNSEDNLFRTGLIASMLCNDSMPKRSPGQPLTEFLGDPTEGCLLVAGEKCGINADDIRGIFPRIAEIPFDSVRKRMTTVHKASRDYQGFKCGEVVSFTKGSIDGMIPLCSSVLLDSGVAPIDNENIEKIRKAAEALASKGMRVLGITMKKLDAVPEKVDESFENGLCFVGLAAMIDPPRESVKGSIAIAREAGIHTVMITGDHPLTASAIAASLNMAKHPEVLTGEHLNKMSPDELVEKVRSVSVYARVSPEDKLKIIDALQKNGEIAAMTGDGVNDAPALKKANIGVAMGITGTDVAKEASGMVLLDDNFSTIVAAVKEGRVIFENIVRFVRFSIGGNIAKVLVVLLAPLFDISIALKPLQLLWLNLLTDGFLGLGLGTEPAEADVMKRAPRKPDGQIFELKDVFQVTWVGLLIGSLALINGVCYFKNSMGLDMIWQTMIFSSIGFAQLGQALAVRSSSYSAFSIASNPAMAFIVLLTIVMQVGVIYIPGVNSFFGLVPLSLTDFLVSAAPGLLVFGCIRAVKLFCNSRV